MDRLLQDYNPPVIPNTVQHTFTGHTSNIKCVAFVGEVAPLFNTRIGWK